MSLEIATFVLLGIQTIAAVVQAYKAARAKGKTLSAQEIEETIEEFSSSSSSSSSRSSSSSSSSSSSKSSSSSSSKLSLPKQHYTHVKSATIGITGSAAHLSVLKSARAVNKIKVIDEDILTLMNGNIKKAVERLGRALIDQTKSNKEKDTEVEIASASICVELMRIRKLNKGTLPEEGLEKLWQSFGCG